MYVKPVLIAAALVALLPSIAQAHPASGLEHGFLHPLVGFDHLLAMMASGLLAFRIGGKALWAVPAAFVGMLLIGAAWAMSGGALPLAEGIVVFSIACLALAALAKVPLSLGGAMAFVGAFALFHGYAHGVEIPADASVAGYVSGIALATAALHGAGIAIGLIAQRLQFLASNRSA
jgi:urease accessory protein